MAKQPVHQLSQEMRLLAACCEQPPSPKTAERIAALAHQIDDWKAFSRLAVRHQLQGFVAHRLGSHEAVPQGIRKVWLKKAQERTAFNLRQAQATARLHQLLRDAGIDNLVLKGLPLALKAYRSLSIKRSMDIDLLVRGAQAERAAQLLGEAGFRSVIDGKTVSGTQLRTVMRHHKEITLADENGIVVDLHWRLVSDPRLLKGVDPFGRAASAPFDKIGEIAVLDDADEFAYLCAHGAVSDWSRLKWLVDVNALVAARSDADLLALYAHADRLGAGRCALQALALREVFWEHPVPPSLRAQIDRLDCAEFLAFPLDRMAAPYHPASFRETARWALRRRKVATTLYGSSAREWHELKAHLYALPDMLAVPLPRALDWLYLPLRPLFWLRRRLG